MNDESEEQTYELVFRTGRITITELLNMSPRQREAAIQGMIDSESPNVERDDFGNNLTPGEMLICLRCGERSYQDCPREHYGWCRDIQDEPRWIAARVARDLAEAARKR